jgi:nickel-dependent lactate racemase
MLIGSREGSKVFYRNIVSEVFHCHQSFAIVPGINAEKIAEHIVQVTTAPAEPTVRVENHYARNDEDHVLVGATKTRGTVVRLDKRFAEADLKIVTGLVEP